MLTRIRTAVNSLAKYMFLKPDISVMVSDMTASERKNTNKNKPKNVSFTVMESRLCVCVCVCVCVLGMRGELGHTDPD